MKQRQTNKMSGVKSIVCYLLGRLSLYWARDFTCINMFGSSGRGVIISCFPYFFVSLSPACHPLLCFSRYHVNHAVWLPILKGSALALSKIKKLCCKSNHSAPSNVIIEVTFLRHKFTPRAKIFSVLWTTVVRSELRGKVFHGQIFPHHTEKYRLALLFLRRISTASETDETLTRLTQSTHVYICHAISFMSYDV